MSFVANQYNYATPLSKTSGLVKEVSSVVDNKLFTLFNNSLDGSYYPIAGDNVTMGSALSDNTGVLSEPFIITVTDNLTVNAFRIVGSQHCYPVAFSVTFYNAGNLLYSFTESNNSRVEYVHYLDRMIQATSYVLIITKVSQPNSVAVLRNLYNPAYIRRTDTVRAKLYGVSNPSDRRLVVTRDRLLTATREATPQIQNTINKTFDTCLIRHDAIATPTNIHSVMKDISRRVYAKVQITYTDPMLASETTITASDTAYNSSVEQALDGVSVSDGRFFTLYDNDLSGEYPVSTAASQVGWVSAKISDANGRFGDDAPYIRLNFASRPIVNLPIYFDESHGAVAEDFTVDFIKEDGTHVTRSITGNAAATVNVNAGVPDVVGVIVTTTRVAKAYYPVAIIDIPVLSDILYVGYHDRSNLISVDFLEELTYEDDVEALGGISANEVTVTLDNSNREFFFNNPESLVASQLKRNRKIIPWFGAEVIPGTIEWYQLGVFWSYSWDVPTEGLTASVVGFDTIGLLDTTSFTDHAMQVNKSLAYLIKYVLDDAKKLFGFIEYDIDPALEDVVIPYAWFESASHTAALRRISSCYPMHIYCDRQGRICAKPQKLQLDYYYDVWADDTNVVSKTYSSLHTTLPNIINVTVSAPAVVADDKLVEDKLAFNVAQMSTRTLVFNKPYVDNISITIDKDASVTYAYVVYSWGIVFTFSGSGNVRNITCTGNALEFNESTIVHKDNDSIRLNGAITRDIKADFIQTSDLASALINRLLGLSKYDKYDANVTYRGDISLTINDPILLLDGIAPDNRYNIKRHELSWNGSLTGSADLNT